MPDPCIDIKDQLGLTYDCEEVSYQSVLDKMASCRGVNNDTSTIREVVELELKVKTNLITNFN